MRIGTILVTSNPFLDTAIRKACSQKIKINILETVSNSQDLLNLIPNLKPKVIIISDDLEESPFKVIIDIMNTTPTPCLFIHSGISRDFVSDYEYALDYGIVDTLEIELLGNKLRSSSIIPIRIGILGKLNLQRFISQIDQVNTLKSKIKSTPVSKKIKKPKHTSEKKEKIFRPSILKTYSHSNMDKNSIVVIGASTGGPKMIVDLISQLPEKFPPVLVVQHMPEGFLEAYAARIDNYSNLKSQVAKEGDEIKSNNVYVAPGGRHLVIKRTTGGRTVIQTPRTEKVNFVRPSVDVTLKSVSPIFRNKTIAVILTGMGVDGRAGCEKVKEFGGKVIALNEEDSLIFGMNKSVIEANLTDVVLSAEAIPIQLFHWLFNNEKEV
ncbi:MAG: Chemotaxis response regulator protein-glutamate methylesterase [Candidatus Heimdallarchaeota archaeon LC_2]|nr:MAG: Chemotaxis response regulator protein-glutamate methylesterase [Candidatus Heimdallarchaeota archaeon LC_2]